MCGPHPYRHVTSERQQLQNAVERLERLKDKEWCGDALLVLEAAKKHLQTLPKPVRYRVTMRGGTPFTRAFFESRSEAVAFVTVNLTRYNTFEITEVG